MISKPDNEGNIIIEVSQDKTCMTYNNDEKITQGRGKGWKDCYFCPCEKCYGYVGGSVMIKIKATDLPKWSDKITNN